MKKQPPSPRVQPWIITVDTREQLPWDFAREYSTPGRPQVLRTVRTQRGTLHAGDYSILGMHGLVAVERKSQADFYSTLVHGRDRFERELDRLCQVRTAWVVVEACWGQLIEDAPRFTDAPPRCFLGSVLAWRTRFPGVHWLMAPGRDVAEAMTYRILERAWTEEKRKVKKCRGRDY